MTVIERREWIRRTGLTMRPWPWPPFATERRRRVRRRADRRRKAASETPVAVAKARE